MSLEFRVCWVRQGRATQTRIYQTEKAAREKIDRILGIEEVKGDIAQLEDMPDLEGPPVLQQREVGLWGEHPDQPPSVATAGSRDGARLYFAKDYGDGSVFT